VNPTREPKPTPPFCWQNKEARRYLRTKLRRGKGSSVLPCYVALTELASNASNPTFLASLSNVADLANVCWRTAQYAVSELVKIGLVIRKRTGRTGLYKYTLLACPKVEGRHAIIAYRKDDDMQRLHMQLFRTVQKKNKLIVVQKSLGVSPSSVLRTGEGEKQPPQKTAGRTKPINGVLFVYAERRLRELKAERAAIRRSYDDHRWPQDASTADRNRHRELCRLIRDLEAKLDQDAAVSGQEPEPEGG
jgi:hypothetical protein